MSELPTTVPFADASALDSRPTDKDAAIAAASATVRRLAGWHIFPSVSETVTVDGSGASVLMLPTLHLTDVTAVRVDGAVVTDVEWHQAGYIVRPGGFVRRPRIVEADIVHGYANPPADLVDVVLTLADNILSNPLSASNERLGDYSVVYGVLTGIQRAALAHYTIPGAA